MSLSQSYFLPLDSPPSLPLSSVLPHALSAVITTSPPSHSDIDWHHLYLLGTIPRKKNAQEFSRRGKEKGSEQCTEGIDSSAVHNKPTDKVLREYRRMIDLWNQYGLPHSR